MNVSELNRFERDSVLGDSLHIHYGTYYCDIEHTPDGFRVDRSDGDSMFLEGNKSLASLMGDLASNHDFSVLDLTLVYNSRTA